MKTVWNEIYRQGERLNMPPHPEMNRVADAFERRKVRRVLDLGSGSGRHTVFLAARGYDVYGLDSSPTGLAHTMTVLGDRKLAAHLTLHDMTRLPYDDNYFDAVISVQVIHHSKLEGIRSTIREIARVLRSGGVIWVTLPVSKNEPSTKQVEIEPGTFLPLDGREKDLPHHYFKMDEIPSLLSEFLVIDVHIDSTNHFSLLAEKRS